MDVFIFAIFNSKSDIFSETEPILLTLCSAINVSLIKSFNPVSNFNILAFLSAILISLTSCFIS